MDTPSNEKIVMKPDAVLTKVSPELALIVFSNHSVAFSGIPVVRALEHLFPLLCEPCVLADATSQIAEAHSVEADVVKLVGELLVSTKCVYAVVPTTNRTGATDFLEILGSDFVDGAKALGPSILICSEVHADSLSNMLNESSIETRVIAVGSSGPLEPIAATLLAKLGSSDRFVLCWGFPYRSAIPRMINRLSLEERFDVLYGFCDTAVGRVGPWVKPRSTACLECLLLRMNANSSNYERLADIHYGQATKSKFPAPPIVYPAFLTQVASSFALEAARIKMRLQPSTFGSFWESEFLSPQTTKRTILRVPRCVECQNRGSIRLPWNAIHPELSVQNSSGSSQLTPAVDE